jgi:hypothetical protein
MISAEAPVLFAKAAEIFIHELTMRAWIHTEVGEARFQQIYIFKKILRQWNGFMILKN